MIGAGIPVLESGGAPQWIGWGLIVGYVLLNILIYLVGRKKEDKDADTDN